MLSHDKFKQIKVKTKIINGSLAPVYKGLEAIECLRIIAYICCWKKEINGNFKDKHFTYKKYQESGT